MYKPLLVNVSVSLIVSGVQPHMTLAQAKIYISLELDFHWSKQIQSM